MSAVSIATLAGGLDDDHARWLMADLLQWHRRETKPEWWLYFERVLTYEADDFVNDAETLGGLELIGQVDVVKQSAVWRYQFDPAQDHKFFVGDKPLDPAAEQVRYLTGAKSPTPGSIVEIDAVQGFVDLRRAKTSTAGHPSALMPGTPLSTAVLERSLRRIAEAVLDHGVDGPGPYAAARALLGRRPPRILGRATGRPLRDRGTTLVASAIELSAGLHESVLPIQGPPGSGKTYTAARVIVDRVRAGERVAVTAFTHAAIRNLLDATIEAAAEAGRDLTIVQKISDQSQAVQHPWVTAVESAEGASALAAGADVVAGTAWFMAREDMIGCADVLIVDEAGQLSLANVVAVAPVASKLVLVGDPQQLSQPSKGTHPDGVGVSALEHLLAGSATVPPERGLLLDETRRLHPDICGFISEQMYDGRLTSFEGCERQEIGPGPLVAGSGLRVLPVEHAGNKTSSVEEASVVKGLVEALSGRSWTDHHGASQVIGPDDILVVTPYNAQVSQLSKVLPAGTRIGTVDKFQGQEAAVVIVSMAASTADDVPRGMEFLFSRNRLNVAVSRARALCVLVASPDLLTVRCRSVEQMRLANVLCRYFELAHQV